MNRRDSLKYPGKTLAASPMHRRISLHILLGVLFSSGFAQIGPWNNPLKMASSADGRFFSASTTFQDSSGVPSAIRWKGDTLICAFQWFRQPIGSPSWDRVAVKFSYNNGLNWTTPTPMVINTFPSNFQRPFDPTLVVTSGDSLRLYYSSSNGLGGPDSSINTYSAISADGVHYNFEPNPRVDHPTRRVIDPAVIYFNGAWHYNSPIGAPQEGAYHYTSANGLAFAQQGNYPSDNMHNWTGNYLVDNAAALRFYGSGPQVWYNTSPDGFSWTGYVNTNIQGGDPTVVKLSSTNYLIIFVGPPYQTGFASQSNEPPGTFALYGNYPNPFNPSTTISYSIARPGFVSLKVYDMLGREVATLLSDVADAGPHEIRWDASAFSSGVYFVRMMALTPGETYTNTRMMLLLR